jgi:hypothetical protein
MRASCDAAVRDHRRHICASRKRQHHAIPQSITPGITPKFRVTRRPVRHSAPSGAGPGALRRFLHSRHQFDHGHDVFDGSLHFCNELIGLREIDAKNRRVTQYLTYLFVMFVSGLNLSGSASSYAMHIVIEVSDQIFERRQARLKLQFLFCHLLFSTILAPWRSSISSSGYIRADCRSNF